MVPRIHASIPDPYPLVSLLLPNRNTAHVLDLVLERLAAHTTYTQVELVAVDDGSTDASPAILRRWRDSARFPDFRLIERDHAGAVKSLNAALECARGEVIVQLDADASIETPGWIELMLAALLFDERVGVVTAKVVLDSGHLHACGVNLVGPDGLHDRPSRITEPTGRRAWHSRVERPLEGAAAEEDRIAEVDSGIGCAMMYRRDDALAAGGYDTGFSPVWFDDLDLCTAIRHGGKKVFYTPDVRVVHHVGARTRASAGGERSSERARRRLRKAASRLGAAGPGTRAALARRMGLNRPRAEHAERLRHHYAYWREKWGWDLLNPDMSELERRHGDSEICWALDPGRRTAGEVLAAELERVSREGHASARPAK